jgi:hypothetical protein
MTYRSFSTGTWQDPWFETLNPNAKLLFIYLWTNDVCNQAGCYQISLRRAEFETGLKLSKTIKELSPKVEWFPEQNIVWIKSFFRRQCANEKFALAGIRSLYSIPKSIVDKFGMYNLSILEKWGIDTVSIPYSSRESGVYESVTGTDTDTDTDTVITKLVGFDEFWKAYPKKAGKQEAKKAWGRQNGNRPTLEIIISKITDMKKTEQWKKQNGQFIPHPATWLNRGGWDDESRVEIESECDGPRSKILRAPDGI